MLGVSGIVIKVLRCVVRVCTRGSVLSAAY